MPKAADIRLKKIYDPADRNDGARVLVDRLWPRGARKEEAKLTLWLKDIAPSAELRPNQTDQDTLPPYDILDAILKGYVEEGLSRKDLVGQGFDDAVVRDVIRKVDLNEYKRKQAPPGLKVTSKAFSVGRRFPLAQKFAV